MIASLTNTLTYNTFYPIILYLIWDNCVYLAAALILSRSVKSITTTRMWLKESAQISIRAREVQKAAQRVRDLNMMLAF